MTKTIIAPKTVARLGRIQVKAQSTMLTMLVNGDNAYRHHLSDVTVSEMELSLAPSIQTSKPQSTVA